MTVGPLVSVLAVLVLWLWLVNSWRLRNWRAATLTLGGTAVFLLVSLLPAPGRALAMGGTWLVIAWILVFHPDGVGVMAKQEYDYVDAHVAILRRIDRRKHSSRRLDGDAYVRAFEADVRALAALRPPPSWKRVHYDTVRELDGRLNVMKSGSAFTNDEQRAANQRWLDVGQLFRETLKARAGFWVGWPHLIQRPSA